MVEAITLRCRVCGDSITRALHTPEQHWVHVDDEVVIRGTTVVSSSRYDHPGDPDVIDVGVVKDTPKTDTEPIIAPWRFPATKQAK